MGERAVTHDSLDQLIAAIAAAANPVDHILIMSNGGFGGINKKLLKAMGAVAEK